MAAEEEDEPKWVKVSSKRFNKKKDLVEMQADATKIAKLVKTFMGDPFSAFDSVINLLADKIAGKIEAQVLNLSWGTDNSALDDTEIFYNDKTGDFVSYVMTEHDSSKEFTLPCGNGKRQLLKIDFKLRKMTAGNEAAKKICQRLESRAGTQLVDVLELENFFSNAKELKTLKSPAGTCRSCFICSSSSGEVEGEQVEGGGALPRQVTSE